MLVLTRKQNEKIRIGDSITITVLKMKGKAVRLGIEAPHDISVIRGELCFDLDEAQSSSETSQDCPQESSTVPPKSKPLAAGSQRDLTSEVTSHWPLAELGQKKVDLRLHAQGASH